MGSPDASFSKSGKTMSLLVLLSLSLNAFAQTSSTLIPKKGLIVTTNGLTWTAGSEVSFFTPDKKHHHYYFTWWEQDVDTSITGTRSLLIGSDNTAVNGSYSLRGNDGQALTAIDCHWNLPDSGVADVVYARIWWPFFKDAVWKSPTRQYDAAALGSFNDTVITAFTPFGDFRFQASKPFQIRLDQNPMPRERDYNKRAQYLLMYENNITVTQKEGLHRDFTLKPETLSLPQPGKMPTQPTVLKAVAGAWQPTGQPQVLLPQPKLLHLNTDYYSIPLQKPAMVSPLVSQFRTLLQQHWQIGSTCFPNMVAKPNMALAAEGYAIDVVDEQIRVEYKTEQGLQHALQTLVQLVQNQNGTLVIPQGSVKDEPSISWRGIHMFTGPGSWALHRRMYERVLFPLKMNKTVLQCEQAEWKSRPEVHNAISVPLKDLAAEFDFLRLHHCEPVPLIQSLGHMEWFFKPVKNRFMAVNPRYPYTLNPDLPQSKQAVKAIWDEAFALLKPKIMHIGFDEIGMIGFNLPRQKEVDFFKTQIGFLDNYARTKGATLMLWGDMGLAPGEGPDACNGVSRERAAAIRRAIPAGSYVADWHYLGNPDPGPYLRNLQIWKANKNLPLASPWLYPDNVRGFVQAAITENAGLLQTTWADFESSEQNMLLNIEQFGAYVLALDYAWSGRKELPENLPYDAIKQWTQRFYDQPKPIPNKNGWRLAEPVQLRNMSSNLQKGMPSEISFSWKSMRSSGFKLKANTAAILPEGSPVALLQFYDNDKLVGELTLRYGVELRGKTDSRPIFGHLSAQEPADPYWFHFFQNNPSISGVSIKSLHPAGGLTVEDLVLME